MEQRFANRSPQVLDFVSPEDLSDMDRLEILSRRVVDGILAGRHESKLKGGSAEFTEHRAYVAGDEIRQIDWKVYAKSDRYYIKQYIEQTCLHAMLVLDCSGSMAFQWKHASKFDFARAAAVCFSRIVLKQTDAVGLTTSRSGGFDFLPSRSNPNHFQAVLERLRQLRPEGEGTLASTLTELLRRLRRRGLIIVLSDCFEDLGALKKALSALRTRGHDVIVFHIMAPEELAFEFDGWSRFESLEAAGVHLDLDPALMRGEYLERVNQFLRDLRRVCGQTRCDYAPLPTNESLGAALTHYLKRRSAQLKAR